VWDAGRLANDPLMMSTEKDAGNGSPCVRVRKASIASRRPQESEFSGTRGGMSYVLHKDTAFRISEIFKNVSRTSDSDPERTGRA
jgi:hypothetical protein